MVFSAKRDVVFHAPKHQHWRKEVLTAHQVLRRSLERIIELAPEVQGKQQKQFLLFCSTFLEFLHEHHSIEDEICFPLLVGPCKLQLEVDQLEAEHDHLVKLMGSFEDSLELPYSGTKVQAAATALKDTMYRHLEFEESVLCEKVLARADPAIFDEIFKQVQAVIKKADPFTLLPFFISHLTPEEADFMVFDHAPWLLKHILLPLVFSRRHTKAWALAARPQSVAVTACYTALKEVEA